ncbi:hypothetical protein OG337_29090 [[Kitasatospora] papulosa]|uniref:hypothetical protein n=1 Tax=[Kitasatospora] papulosa TaxID=1464011 RepID=UPI0038706DAF|nr:hypothetical protein OG337_29090 [[Kitasatospora] papulosa]
MSWGEGSMNWAELRDLVEHLPEDSATRAAASGDEEGRRWTQDTYVAASTYNATLLMIRILWAAHLKGHPPEMGTIDPPRLTADVEAEERAAALTAYHERVLDAFSPSRASDDDDIGVWTERIRELEAQQ